MSIASLQPSTLQAIGFLEGIRQDILTRISGFSEDEARRIPEGSRNSIHWNMGHILHVQLAHWYTRRGKPLPLDLGWKTYFREGKSPADYDGGTPDFPVLLAAYREFSTDLIRRHGAMLEEPLTIPFDYLGGRFGTIADDLHLLLFHEGEHYVLIKRILKGLGRA